MIESDGIDGGQGDTGGGRLLLPGSGVREMGAGPGPGEEGPWAASMLTGASGHSVWAGVFMGEREKETPVGRRGQETALSCPQPPDADLSFKTDFF